MHAMFENGYGVSVIDNGYGSAQGLYELAVLDNDGICYDTPITEDVIGYLTWPEVEELIEQVKALPAK